MNDDINKDLLKNQNKKKDTTYLTIISKRKNIIFKCCDLFALLLLLFLNMNEAQLIISLLE